jgi:hypothetical protein
MARKGTPNRSMAKFVKSSVRAAINLVNSEALFPFERVRGRSARRGLGHVIFAAESYPQQTEHAPKSPTRCFLKRATATRTSRNL